MSGRKKQNPNAWQIGRIKLIDKGKGTDQPGNMRPISILNAEGRIFWTIYQERLASFMTSNGFINRSVQKAFLEKMAGCIEHATMASEMLRDAKSRQKQICMIWLDLANAYGSVRHSMVYYALEWYHVPEDMIELIFNYYEGICLQVQTEDWSSAWFGLEVGVPQGCTASTIIFNVAFQMVLDIHSHLIKSDNLGYGMLGMSEKVVAPAYADDVKLVATNPKGCQKSVIAFEKALDWTQTMKLKPSKCKSLAFKKFVKGRSSEFVPHQDKTYSCFNPKLLVYGKESIFIGDEVLQSFKYLGMWIQANLKSDGVRESAESMLKELLKKVDALLLTGAMKAWIANHYVSAKLAWVLLIQDFPQSVVKDWDIMMKKFYKKWLGIFSRAEVGILYRSSENFGLGLKSFSDSLTTLQVAKWHIMKTSEDPFSQKLYQRRLELDRKGHLGTGRKDSPCLLIERTERRLELDKMAFSGQSRKAGLGSVLSKSKKMTKREQVINVLKTDVEEKRVLEAYPYEMQTNWVEYGLYKGPKRKDLTWEKMLSYTPNLLSFTINAQCSTLPSPDNLRRWNATRKDIACGLCGNLNVTLSHILCGCIWVNLAEMKLPQQSRFKWRHDNILAVVAHYVRGRIEELKSLKMEKKCVKEVVQDILFVKQGAKVQRSMKLKSVKDSSLLNQARDWEVLCDLVWERSPGSIFLFPQDVALTNLKPDLLIVSRSTRRCILIELTAPLEENIESRHSTKKRKYTDEVLDNLQPGWKVEIVCIEVGAKGWIPPSFTRDLRKVVGFSKSVCRKLANDCQLVARKCSYVIWLNRSNKEFQPIRVIPPSLSSITPSSEVKLEQKVLKPSKLHLKLREFFVKRPRKRRKRREKRRLSLLTSVREVYDYY